MQLVEHDRELLPLAGRLAANGEELRGVGYRLEYDHELVGQLQRQHRPFAGRYFDGLERGFIAQAEKVILIEINSRTPENLPDIFPERQRIRIVRRDTPHPR